MSTEDENTAAAHWENQASNWISWVRTPGHDAYWHYSPSFFELTPPAGRATLDLGCGEGRVTRDLASRGHRMTSIDLAPTLLEAARKADPEGIYIEADAADLPFKEDSFDLVVAYNCLMDVDDMPGALREAARVLQPGGRLCLSVTHPTKDAGSFTSEEPDAPFVISGSYLGRHPIHETLTKDGLTMVFSGWAYALEEYTRALSQNRLLIEAMREPAMPTTGVTSARYERWSRLPMFLWIRALLPARSLC